MVYTYTNVHTEGENDFYKAGEIFRNLGLTFEKVFHDAKKGKVDLTFEIPKFRKHDFDSGVVSGADFTLELIDLYGDNPMYNYSDAKGGFFVQIRFPMRSSVMLGDGKILQGSAIITNEEAVNYVKEIETRMQQVYNKKHTEEEEEPSKQN